MKKYIILILLLSKTFFANSAIVILNGLTHTHTIEGGQKVTGSIQIRNESNKPARVLVYKQDLVAKCGLGTNYLDSASLPFSLSPYLTTAVDEKVLDGNEEYVLYYNIEIPASTLKDGSYWSVLMVEAADPVKEQQPNGMNINSIVRYAVQIIGDYGQVESPKLTFEDIKINNATDTLKVLTMRIRNDGLFTTSTKVILELYNTSGEKVKVIEAIRRRIYPSSCGEFEIELKQLPKGKYDGIIIADNGKDLFGANVSVEIN
jgi:hypothetical protein